MMEILQNIITAFTTENELMNILITIPLILIDTIVMMLLLTTFLHVLYSKKQKYLYIFTILILCFITRNFIPDPYAVILNMLILPLSFYFIFRTSKLKACIAGVIAFSIGLILELTFSKIFAVIFQANYIDMVNTPIFRIIVSCLIYFCVFLLYLFIKKFKFTLPMLESLNKHTKKLLIINLVLAVFMICFQFFLMFYYSDTYSLIVNILNIISLLAYFVISILSFISTSELSITTENLEREQLSKQTLQLFYNSTEKETCR